MTRQIKTKGASQKARVMVRKKEIERAEKNTTRERQE